MRQGQPDRPQLQQARSAGVEDAARDVNVRNRIAIEQYFAAAEIEQEGKNRNACGRAMPAGRSRGPSAGSAARSFQMGQLAEDLKAGVNFLRG